ncbi:LOW QUALITY PROTEIN: hypothetical protein SETIT_3G279000v2, partial [Setaria italica]
MEEEARPSKKARGAAGSGLTAFALRLNLAFSPVSIYDALSLVAAGARGTTLDELLALLGALAEFARGVAERALADRFGSGSRAPLVAFACGLWHEKTVALKPAYRAVAVESYKAKTRAADFSKKPEKARKKINRWVSKATKDLITEVLPPRSVHSPDRPRDCQLNAIYFKGRWSMPFDQAATETARFHLLYGSTVRAPFMRNRKDHAIERHKGFKDSYLHDGSGQGSGEQPRFSMCVFLPDARDGLPELVDKMASCPNFLWDHLPKSRIETKEVRLPMFKLSFSSRINGVLEAMGMQAAFDPGESNLKDMLEGNQPLVVEHVFHKAVIEVNEDGTEAAASSACTLQLLCLCTRPPVNFVADHPFAFFVVEEVSSTIIFMGHVLDPTNSERMCHCVGGSSTVTS